jgi:hypothetical protein
MKRGLSFTILGLREFPVAGFPIWEVGEARRRQGRFPLQGSVATTTALQAICVKPGSGVLEQPRCKDPFERVSLGAAALTKQVPLCWLAALTFRETAE